MPRLDLDKPGLIAEAATGTSDDDLQARALLVHAELVDEWSRLAAHADGLRVAAAEHEEAGLLRQRKRTCPGPRVARDRLERERHVPIGRRSVAGEPGETRRERRRFCRSFGIRCCAKSVECFRQQLDAVAAKAEQRACVLEQEPRPCRVIRSLRGRARP